MRSTSALSVGTAPATRIRRAGIGLLGVLLSAAAIALLVTLIDVSTTIAVLRGTDLRWLAPTLLLIPIQIVFRTLRWRLILPRRGDGRRPSVARVAPVLMAGYLGNLLLPARLGEPVRAYLLARREEIGFPRVLGSVLLERVMDLATLAIVAFLAALAAGAPTWMVRGVGAVAAFGLIALLLLVTLGLPRLVRLIARLTDSRRRLARPISILVSFGQGAGGDDRSALTAAIALSSVTWLFVATSFWLVNQALGLGLDPAAALLVAAVTVLGTAIPSAPGHIGTFEAAAVVSATALGVPAAEALALALLAHAVSTLPLAAAGAVAVAWMSISLGSVAQEAAVAGTEDGALPDDSAGPPRADSYGVEG